MGYTLIVEDSVTERAIITDYLQQIGINVSIATSGEEALRKIEAGVPDLIVLDVVLPGRSKFETCRQLKETDPTNKIPIIICSTKNTDVDKFLGKKQGADAYISKPIDQKELISKVKELTVKCTFS